MTAQNSQRAAPHFEQHQPHVDLQALQELAAKCFEFSPTIGLEQKDDTSLPSSEPQALLLDISGCVHLFGGEQQLAERIHKNFLDRQYLIRIGLADTIGAAWAAAHFSPTREDPIWIIAVGCQATVMSDLPVAALRLDAAVLQTLDELDLRTIGDLSSVPRKSFSSRFGDQVLKRLQQFWGERSEPLIPINHSPDIEAWQTFEYPLRDKKALGIVLHRLIEQLLVQLQQCQRGIQRLQIRLSAEHERSLECSVGFLRCTNDASYLCQMVQARLEQERLPKELNEVHLQVSSSVLLNVQQNDLFDTPEAGHQQRQYDLFLERISTRLGEDAVLSAYVVPDAQPEYAFAWQTVFHQRADAPRNASARSKPQPHSHQLEIPDHDSLFFSARPLWLPHQPQPITVLAAVTEGPPIRFRWRGSEYAVCQSWGPERIETGWWRAAFAQRDYYRVETKAGQRFWLFRQAHSKNWFLHGVFA